MLNFLHVHIGVTYRETVDCLSGSYNVLTQHITLRYITVLIYNSLIIKRIGYLLSDHDSTI
jgi:hypothetical protein